MTITRTYLLLAILLLAGAPPLLAQPQDSTSRDTLAGRRVEVDYADALEYLQRSPELVEQRLVGQVELRQDSIYMYCDSAYIRNETYVRAMRNVIIQQGDSITAFSDSLVYDSEEGLAQLFGEVVLVNGEQQLFTDRLDYDLVAKVATYTTGATLFNGESQLSSKRGYYYVDEKTIYFKDSVAVVDPKFNLRADTLQFETETKVVTFLGPTRITNDSSVIYCEGGFYDTEQEKAAFWDQAEFTRGDQQAAADTIRYDGGAATYVLDGNAWFNELERRATADRIVYNERSEATVLIGRARVAEETQLIEAEKIRYNARSESYATRGRTVVSDPPNLMYADQMDFDELSGMGIASGQVVWQDTAAQLSVHCDTALYRRTDGYLKAFSSLPARPYLTTQVEGDSLFLAADTLVSLRSDTLASDSNRLLFAYRDVRLFKSDLQGLCDSLAYSTQDSLFRLFYDPVMWSDTTQFLGDTLLVQLSNQEIDKIYLREKAMILNTPEELFFNEIKGRNITAHFEAGELRRMNVVGNASSTYYALDEQDAYIGVNTVECSEQVVYFSDRDVERIVFLDAPKGQMDPMPRPSGEVHPQWRFASRPRSIEALFGERAPANEPEAYDESEILDVRDPPAGDAPAVDTGNGD